MLTGRAVFARDTVTDTFAAIVEREPEWSALPDATPMHLRRLLQRCLDKDPKRRLRDIGDARLDLHAVPDAPIGALSSRASRPLTRAVVMGGTVVVALSAFAVGRFANTDDSVTPTATRLVIPFGDGDVAAFGPVAALSRDENASCTPRIGACIFGPSMDSRPFQSLELNHRHSSDPAATLGSPATRSCHQTGCGLAFLKPPSSGKSRLAVALRLRSRTSPARKVARSTLTVPSHGTPTTPSSLPQLARRVEVVAFGWSRQPEVRPSSSSPWKRVRLQRRRRCCLVEPTFFSLFRPARLGRRGHRRSIAEDPRAPRSHSRWPRRSICRERLSDLRIPRDLVWRAG